MNFPNLETKQIAILYAERNTGIVLNKDLKYNTNSQNLEYIIFDSIDEAKIFCSNKIKEPPHIECNFFDSKNNQFLRIDIKGIHDIPVK